MGVGDDERMDQKDRQADPQPTTDLNFVQSILLLLSTRRVSVAEMIAIHSCRDEDAKRGWVDAAPFDSLAATKRPMNVICLGSRDDDNKDC